MTPGIYCFFHNVARWYSHFRSIVFHDIVVLRGATVPTYNFRLEHTYFHWKHCPGALGASGSLLVPVSYLPHIARTVKL